MAGEVGGNSEQSLGTITKINGVGNEIPAETHWTEGSNVMVNSPNFKQDKWRNGIFSERFVASANVNNEQGMKKR